MSIEMLFLFLNERAGIDNKYSMPDTDRYIPAMAATLFNLLRGRNFGKCIHFTKDKV